MKQCIALVLSTVLVGAVVLFPSESSAASASFFFAPESGVYKGDVPIVVELKFASTEPITAVNLVITFDTKLLSVANIQIANSSFAYWLERSIGAGQVRLQASHPTPLSSGQVAVITFQPLKSGTATIAYGQGSLALLPNDVNIFSLTASKKATFQLQGGSGKQVK